MEKTKRFNLEVALFLQDLNAHIENVNETDDETIKLLTETVLAVDKLQINSKFRENRTSNENNFALTLDDEIFECRRYIVCRLCHENIPLSSEDFEVHTQKRSHKEKEINLQSKNNRMNGKKLLHTESSISINSSCTSSINESNEESKQSSADILPSPTPAVKLEDVIDVAQISQTISNRIIGIKSRTAARINNEKQILTLLTRHLKALDSKTELIPFGSSTYGLGEPYTNLNILLVSAENPIKALHSFGKILNTLQSEFDVLPILHGDRVYKRRLHVVHKKSKIVCWIQFGYDFELAESSQVIRDSIVHLPLCYHMIMCIRSWQIAVNEAAAEKGLEVFQFSTYIIAVLVIFYLQVNKTFPKLKDLPSSKSKCINFVDGVKNKTLRRAINQFFDFYGNIYQLNTHLISINIGRWQEQRMPAQQKNLTPEQKKLREGISSNPFNWENCTMFVQDIKSPGTNITAEITKEEANNFKKMCQLFSSDNTHTIFIDEYVSKLSQDQPANEGVLKCDSEPNTSNFLADQNLESTISSCESSDKRSSGEGSCVKNNVTETESASKINNSTNTVTATSVKKLEDFVNIEDVDNLTIIEMGQMLSISESRMNSEREIINALLAFLTSKHSIRALIPCGSACYGFAGPKTNFNIFIIPGNFASTLCALQASFENAIKTFGTQLDFELQGKLKENRVQKEQLKIVHTKTQIQCTLQFGTESDLDHSQEITRIITDYIRLFPMCKRLIAYIKGWQNVLNDVATKNGLQAFNFNTYIISVLVIFYLQTNHALPVVKNLTSNRTIFLSNGNLAPFSKEFFIFYGTTFDNKRHLISVNVGKWQQIVSEGQKYFTPEQKSMRDGITACPANWSNCSMYVQDLVSPCTNITAEIPEQDVDNFVQMCRMFSKHIPKYSIEAPNLTSAVNPAKNDAYSFQLRSSGNSKFKEELWFEAMELYNKSLQLATEGSENIALAYGNRSACFLRLKKYNRCLTDINLAKKANYPQHSMQKLVQREADCLKLIKESQQVVAKVEPELSFEPDEKFPCMANVLEIRSNDEYGKYIVAKQKFEVGQIVSAEKVLVYELNNHDRARCETCLMQMMNFIPCPNCADVMFCSTQCMESNEIHKIGCGAKYHNIPACKKPVETILIAVDAFSNDIDELMKFVEKCLVSRDFRSLEGISGSKLQYGLFLKLAALREKPNPILVGTIYQMILQIPRIKQLFDSELKKHFLCRLIVLHVFILETNSMAFAALSISGNRIIAFVVRPIEKGEQLCICKFPLIKGIPAEARKVFLWDQFQIDCKCSICVPRFNHSDRIRMQSDPISKFLDHPLHEVISDEKKRSIYKEKFRQFLCKYGRLPWSPEINLALFGFQACVCEDIQPAEV